MKALIFLTGTFIIFSFSFCNSPVTDQKEVLLITGGHSYDTTEFFDFFLSLDDFDIDTISQPSANDYLVTDAGKEYEVYIFYDMWRQISDEQMEAYIELAEMGKGFLFLHHSLVSYQEWDEFKKLTGGRYHQMVPGKDSSLLSTYKHDIDLNVKIADPDHPITAGMEDFYIHDEGYGNLDLVSGITPLLTTDHPDCHPIISWTNQYRNSSTAYLIFGHDKKAYEDPNFKVLIENSIRWLAKK